MATNNSNNNEYTNNADGFAIGGGTTKRTLTVTGGDITLTGGATVKGDILASDGTDFDIITVGANDTVLTADSTTANGVKWAAGGGGGGGTLDASYDFGGAGLGRSVTADSGAVEITIPDTSNNVGLIINQNDTTNNPKGLSVTSPSATVSPVEVVSTNAGNRGPFIDLFHDTATPAINDYAGLQYYSNNSSAAKTLMGTFSFALLDDTAATEDSYAYFQNIVAGSLATRLTVGYIGDAAGNGIAVGDSVGEAFIGSFAATDLTLRTGGGITGTISIANGANGNISILPNGTGVVNIDTITISGDQVQTTGAGTIVGFQDIAAGNGDTAFTVYDENFLELLVLEKTASAVNEISITNAATGNAPLISATGTDTNIDLTISPKGTGQIVAGSDISLGENSLKLDGVLSATDKWSGVTLPATAGVVGAFGDALYFDATAVEWLLVDASAAATSGSVPVLLALGATTDGGAVELLVTGIVRDTAWTWTVGGQIYLSETGTTGNTLTQTAPTTTDSVTKVVGYAISATEMIWNPSVDYITHV